MSFLLDLIFPRFCFVCGRFGDYFCPYCTKKLNIGKLNHLSSPRVEAHLSIFNDPNVKKAITSLKYNFVTDLAPSLAKISAYTLKNKFPLILEYWRQSDFCFIPVPLHYYRQNWRGFNQASLIGEYLAKFLKLPFNPDLVIKTKYTDTQAKTSHKALRLKNQQSAFSLSSSLRLSASGGSVAKQSLSSKPTLSLSKRHCEELATKQSQPLPFHIIIFDDVYTTGATTTSLANIFPKNTSIWILSLV